MKVAVITNFYPPEAQGGAEVYAHDLSLSLARQGFDVEVFTSTSGRPCTELEGGVTIRRFHTVPPLPRFTNDALGYNHNPWAAPLARAIARADCDVTHVHNIHTAIMLGPLLKAIHGPVVCHVHDHWPVCYRGILYDPTKREMCTRESAACCFGPGHRTIGRANLHTRTKLLAKLQAAVSMFITPSKYMKLTLVARGFSMVDKIRVVRLGIDLNAIPAPPAVRAKRFAFVGRLVYYKNPQFFLDLAAADVGTAAASFVLIGAGPEKKALVRQSAQRAFANLELKGPLTRKGTLEEIARSRAVIIPSLIPENSPLVAYEALAAGTPVLCSQFGGTRELVEDSHAGASLAIDRIKDWRASLVALLDDEFFSRTSAAARNFAAKNLDIHQSATEIARVYDDVARGR